MVLAKGTNVILYTWPNRPEVDRPQMALARDKHLLYVMAFSVTVTIIAITHTGSGWPGRHKGAAGWKAGSAGWSPAGLPALTDRPSYQFCQAQPTESLNHGSRSLLMPLLGTRGLDQ